MLKVLELFASTRSVSKAFERREGLKPGRRGLKVASSEAVYRTSYATI